MASSPRTACLPAALLLLLLAAATLLASSCHASTPATAAAASAGGEKAATMGHMTDPKCSEMARCTPAMCTDYCFLIGLGNQKEKGFCTFHGLLFYCCCPVPFRRDAAPVISS